MICGLVKFQSQAPPPAPLLDGAKPNSSARVREGDAACRPCSAGRKRLPDGRRAGEAVKFSEGRTIYL